MRFYRFLNLQWSSCQWVKFCSIVPNLLRTQHNIEHLIHLKQLQLIENFFAQPYLDADPKGRAIRDGELDRESRLAPDVPLQVERHSRRQGNPDQDNNRLNLVDDSLSIPWIGTIMFYYYFLVPYTTV